MRTILLAPILLAVCPSASAQEQHSPTSCTAVAEPWKAARAGAAAGDAANVAQAGLALGEPIRLSLHPEREVDYLVRSDEQRDAETFGGLATFTVEQAGVYEVRLRERVWIDVVTGGKAAPTDHFGHGPDCSGIRKQVAFDLAPGTYVLEISGASGAETGVLVERLP